MAETTLRDAVRRLREVLGFRQEQLARRMGTTTRTIAAWESGSMESLRPDLLVQLRHLALEASNEDLARFFDDRLLENFADRDSLELGAAVYSFLPGNRKEMMVVGELLRRLREDDPAIEPIVAEILDLLEQRLLKERKELEQLKMQRLKPKLTLADLMKPDLEKDRQIPLRDLTKLDPETDQPKTLSDLMKPRRKK